MAPHSSTLAWKIPWMEEPGRLQSIGVAEGRTRLSDFTYTFHFHAVEKEMATHSSVLAWRIPGTGEPVGLPSMRLHRVRHDWSDFTYTYIPFLSNLPPISLPILPPRLSQSTSFGFPASYNKLPLAICFTYSNVYVSMLFSQIMKILKEMGIPDHFHVSRETCMWVKKQP